jgi:hypothetical protein
MSLAAAVAAVLYCLTVARAPATMFNDSDTGWHIVVGEQILATHTVPHSDSFSFLHPGHGWFAWEWAAEMAMGAVHRWRGLPGVGILFTLAIGAAVWMCFRLHRRLGGNFFLAIAMAAPLLATAQVHWLARPHVLSYLCLFGVLFYLENGGTAFRVRDGAVLALGTALWAGIHGSFPLAVALPMLYGAGYLMRPLIWRDLDRAFEWARARWCGLAAACAAAGSILNPYGTALWRHVAAFSTAGELTRKIDEWRPLDLSRPDAGIIMAVAAVAALGAILAAFDRDLPHALASAFLVALGWKAVRGLPMVALVALPMANAAITRAIEKARRWLPAAGSFLRFSSELSTLDRVNHGAALAPLLVLALAGWWLQPEITAATEFPRRIYPVGADAVVASLPASSRIFASSGVGGYWTYRFRGSRKIWIDGRADYFGIEPFDQFDRILNSRPGWQDTIRQVGFTHALVANHWPANRTMEQAGWKMLYRGRAETLFEVPAGF